jgi:hypothetical protein
MKKRWLGVKAPQKRQLQSIRGRQRLLPLDLDAPALHGQDSCAEHAADSWFGLRLLPAMLYVILYSFAFQFSQKIIFRIK